YTIPNLNPQTTYSIQLSAHVNNTLSEPVSITARTQPVHTRTGSEPNISSQKLGFGNYSVGWRSVQGPVQYYRVIYVRRSGGNTTQISVPGRVNEILLNNLNPAEVYDVTITAVLPNQEIVVGNLEISTSAESQPTEDSSRSAWIEWEQHPFMFTSYRITAIPVTGGQTHRWEVGAGESNARLSDLEPGTLYNILVEGFTNGQYVTVADIQRRTDIDPPSNLRIIKSNTNVIGLHWNPPKSNITGYSLTYQLDGRGTETAYIPPPRSTDV
uniref:Fibronectin type-III domain-containing protein n=1 Tax=Ciona savignyi TaxID=51511 RepID=H2ZJT0_CIOSA